MNRIRIAAVLAALALIPAAAQAQTTITACYVPKSGSVYRIKVEGSPTKCAQNHVEFSWTDGLSAAPLAPTVYSEGYAIPASDTIDLYKSCPLAGQVLVTGGYQVAGTNTQDLEIQASRPNLVTNWFVKVVNHGDSGGNQVIIWISCTDGP